MKLINKADFGLEGRFGWVERFDRGREGGLRGGGGARMWLRDAGERMERGRKWGGVAVKLGLG